MPSQVLGRAVCGRPSPGRDCQGAECLGARPPHRATTVKERSASGHGPLTGPRLSRSGVPRGTAPSPGRDCQGAEDGPRGAAPLTEERTALGLVSLERKLVLGDLAEHAGVGQISGRIHGAPVHMDFVVQMRGRNAARHPQ